MAKKKSRNSQATNSSWLWLLVIIILLIAGSGKSGQLNAVLNNKQGFNPISLFQSNKVKINSSNNQELINLSFDQHKYTQNYAIINNNQPELSAQAQKRLRIMRAGNNLEVY